MFIMKADLFYSGLRDMYIAGIIQGLIYGLCAIPCNTTLWDCEKFTNVVVFPVDCTEEHCEKVMQIVNAKWPGLCRYEKREREV